MHLCNLRGKNDVYNNLYHNKCQHVFTYYRDLIVINYAQTISVDSLLTFDFKDNPTFTSVSPQKFRVISIMGITILVVSSVYSSLMQIQGLIF